MSSDLRFLEHARALGFPAQDAIRIGGNYTPALREGDLVHVSGQIPRIGDSVVVVGAAGSDVPIDRARFAAQVSTLRALSLVTLVAGTLEVVRSVPRMTVFVRSAADFTLQSEVADAASDLLSAVLGEHARHSRTSLGVLQLPKGATVELDFVFKLASSDDAVRQRA